MSVDTASKSKGETAQKVYRIDGQELKRLAEAGLTWLKTNQQTVNALNVFPVPDGDTGTNMVLTMQSAFNEISDSSEKNAGRMSHALAHGALMGARGNSGVILSQIWRGFARAVDDMEVIDPPAIVDAFASARDTAYKGVVRPVEGTILTVAKDIAEGTETAFMNGQDLRGILMAAVESANQSVQRTPDLLPVLKEAGVVDAGGKGLFFILEGMLRYIQGLSLETALTTVQPLAAMNLENTLEVIEPGQDFEVVMDFRPQSNLDLEKFYTSLEEMGTSIQIGEGDGMYRVHIHVPDEKLYDPIVYARSIGTVTKVAIENLVAQMEELENQKVSKTKLANLEPGQIAVVTVAPGPGLARVFASLGATAIVEGGQTMNPSTQELLNSFENLPTDNVIILPNNKNIIPVSKSAAELTVKNVAVIPTTSIPQGLAAMLRLAPEGDFSQVVGEMTAAIDDVETGEITVATRSVEIDGVKVKQGEIIGLLNGKLVTASQDLSQACLALFEHVEFENYELVTLFYGNNLTKQQVSIICDEIRARYPDIEIEIQDGGQPHYYFIISIE